MPTLLTDAIVEVGDGRGFIVGATDDTRYIVTAAHCLLRWRYPRSHLKLGQPRVAIIAAISCRVNRDFLSRRSTLVANYIVNSKIRTLRSF
jgi:hypothetical protein